MAETENTDGKLALAWLKTKRLEALSIHGKCSTCGECPQFMNRKQMVMFPKYRLCYHYMCVRCKNSWHFCLVCETPLRQGSLKTHFLKSKTHRAKWRIFQPIHEKGIEQEKLALRELETTSNASMEARDVSCGEDEDNEDQDSKEDSEEDNQDQDSEEEEDIEEDDQDQEEEEEDIEEMVGEDEEEVEGTLMEEENKEGHPCIPGPLFPGASIRSAPSDGGKRFGYYQKMWAKKEREMTRGDPGREALAAINVASNTPL